MGMTDGRLPLVNQLNSLRPQDRCSSDFQQQNDKATSWTAQLLKTWVVAKKTDLWHQFRAAQPRPDDCTIFLETTLDHDLVLGFDCEVYDAVQQVIDRLLSYLDTKPETKRNITMLQKYEGRDWEPHFPPRGEPQARTYLDGSPSHHQYSFVVSTSGIRQRMEVQNWETTEAVTVTEGVSPLDLPIGPIGLEMKDSQTHVNWSKNPIKCTEGAAGEEVWFCQFEQEFYDSDNKLDQTRWIFFTQRDGTMWRQFSVDFVWEDGVRPEKVDKKRMSL
ncbi:hypothetical protein T439DRAFT_378194 [Meredithblackwellia eburnea MCA 4105]